MKGRNWVVIAGGAVSIMLLSRVLGMLREFAVVGLIGVHDYTDAYFAISTIVIWVQNWSFGALPLVLVPLFLSRPPSARRIWFRIQFSRYLAWGVAAGITFVAGFQWIEPLMLGGRQVLGLGSVLLLTLCMPVTVIGGLLNARLITTGKGIFASAFALLLANAVGFVSLLIFAFVPGGRPLALPATLFVTHASAALLLSRAWNNGSDQVGTGQPGEIVRQTIGKSQMGATTAENIGFNVSAIVQQGIAGTLATGAVTMNAYAMRVVLLPLTGILQPIQQNLLVRFCGANREDSRKLLNLTAFVALSMGLIVGAAIWIGFELTKGYWSLDWQERFSEFGFSTVLFAYGVYAGVVFTNQAIARHWFADGRGIEYATVMVLAYAVGTALKFVFAPTFGIIGLVSGAIVAESGATALMLMLTALKNGSRMESNAANVSGQVVRP